MRVNVYAEEMTDRVEIVAKEIDGVNFTGVRFYLALPATVDGKQYQGPFIHRPGDDDSAAVTFWGKRDLRTVLRKALSALDAHYEGRCRAAGSDRAGGRAMMDKATARERAAHLYDMERQLREDAIAAALLATWNEAVKVCAKEADRLGRRGIGLGRAEVIREAIRALKVPA